MTLSIRKKIILSFVFIVALGLIRTSMRLYFEVEEKKTMDQMQMAMQFSDYASTIKYLDEVLTMSCRNYIFTSDPYWQKRYQANSQLLDDTIKKAQQVAQQTEWFKARDFQDQDKANSTLVHMEQKIFSLVKYGKQQEARSIIEGNKYAAWKKRYSDIVDRVFHAAKENIKQALDNNIRTVDFTFNIMLMINILSVLLAIILAIYLSASIVRPIQLLAKKFQLLAKGDFLIRSGIKSKDEIGQLAQAFDFMADNLQKSNYQIIAKQKEIEIINLDLAAKNEELEAMNEEISQVNEELETITEELRLANEEAQKAKEAAEERAMQLERFNKVAVGRELMMRDLKAKIEELEAKLKGGNIT